MNTAFASPVSFASPRSATGSNARRWGGRVLLALGLLFLTFDTWVKLAGSSIGAEATQQLGFQAHHIRTIGLIELACLILYAIPRTAPLGALLFTGYLGGAIVTHFRIDNPLFSHILFPTYVAAILWGALYLRDARVRGLFSFSR